MRAEITYNAGKSCTMKSTKFVEGQTQLVEDAEIIQRCLNTCGFAVHVLKEPKKVVLPVEDEPKPKRTALPPADEDDAPAPRKLHRR